MHMYKMPRDHPVKQFFDVVRTKSANKRALLSCKFCHKSYSDNPTNLSVHVKNCPQFPEQLKLDFVGICMKHGFDSPASYNLPKPKKYASPGRKTLQTPSRQLTSKCNRPTKSQIEFHEHFSRAVFGSGLPVSIVESHLWQQLFRMYMPSFSLPEKEVLCTTLLDKEYARIQNTVMEHISTAAFLAIQWNQHVDLRYTTTINIVIQTPKPALLRSIQQAGSDTQTAESMAEKISEFINELGSSRFVSAATDNCKNVIAARQLITSKYSHIVFYGFVDHVLNCLLEETAAMEQFTSVFNGISCLLEELTNPSLKIWFEEVQNIKGISMSLKLPNDSRLGTKETVLNTVLKYETVLKHMSANDHPSYTTGLKTCTKVLLQDDKFWSTVNIVHTFFEPIHRWIKNFQTNSSSVSTVCQAFNEIEEQLRIFTEANAFSEIESEQLTNYFTNCKSMAITKLHLAANLLDPKIAGKDITQTQNFEALEYIEMVASVDPKDSRQQNSRLTVQHVTEFQNKTGIWNSSFIQRLADNDPVKFWETLIRCSPLASVAVKILSMAVVSSVPERFEIVDDLMQCEQPNKSAEQILKLAYVKSNYSLLGLNLSSSDPSTIDEIEQELSGSHSNAMQLNFDAKETSDCPVPCSEEPQAYQLLSVDLSGECSSIQETAHKLGDSAYYVVVDSYDEEAICPGIQDE